jgi:hypothetical protein
MIQTYIHLPKTSYLYKTLRKKGIIEPRKTSDALFIWLKHKPNIGELIEVNFVSAGKNEKLSEYLSNRNKPIIVRITDLKQSFTPMENNDGMNILELKVYEDYSFE